MKISVGANESYSIVLASIPSIHEINARQFALNSSTVVMFQRSPESRVRQMRRAVPFSFQYDVKQATRLQKSNNALRIVFEAGRRFLEGAVHVEPIKIVTSADDIAEIEGRFKSSGTPPVVFEEAVPDDEGWQQKVHLHLDFMNHFGEITFLAEE